MLTDGAVYNTNLIIDLIDKEAMKSNSRVHTFGVGRGADESLVKGAAKAGCGTHSFIYKNSEIESKVILALQKNYVPVLNV